MAGIILKTNLSSQLFNNLNGPDFDTDFNKKNQKIKTYLAAKTVSQLREWTVKKFFLLRGHSDDG